MLRGYFFAALISFLLGRALLFLLRKLALRHRLLISRQIPLIGGISIGLAFILTCLLILPLSKELIGILVSSSLILIFGLLDDWQELNIPAKFLAQLAAGVILILFGIRTEIIYIGAFFNIIITLLWVIGITNAFNHLDVADGVAGSCALIVSLSFFIISFFNQDIKSASLALVITGAVASFLFYNLPPAKVYMGNSGSHFLGFILAAVSLNISYAPLERKLSLFSPILILGFPIFDTIFVSLMRLKNRKSVFQKSDDHLVLRLLKLGYSENKALGFMFLLCAFFSLSGVALSQASNIFVMGIIAMVVLSSLILSIKIARVS